MLQEELGAKSLAAHFQTHATPRQKIPPHISPCPPLLRLTLQDQDMCLCSSLPTSLTETLVFHLAGKTAISIKMYSIFIGLAP